MPLTVGRLIEIAHAILAYEFQGKPLTPLVKALAHKWEVSERVIWYYVKAIRDGTTGFTVRSLAAVNAEIAARQKIRKARDEFESYISNSSRQKLHAKALYEKAPSQLGDAMTNRVMDRFWQEIEIGSALQNARPSEISRLQARVDVLAAEAERDVAELDRKNTKSTTPRPRARKNTAAPS